MMSNDPNLATRRYYVYEARPRGPYRRLGVVSVQVETNTPAHEAARLARAIAEQRFGDRVSRLTLIFDKARRAEMLAQYETQR